MVMDFTVFNTNLHMINHYKRVNSAKSVVNTSAPRSYQLRYKNVSNLTSRYSTPSLMSTSERNPSRANSNCEVRRRKICTINPVTQGERSSSVPPRPCTRRNQNVIPQNYIKKKNPYPKINYNNNTKIKIPIKDEMPRSSALGTTLSPKHNLVLKPEKNINSDKSKSPTRKAPIPAPRASLTAPKTAGVQDYEYLQFSLRITEDIIRNDLYSQKEMRRVFNSHIEANRGRLNMTKMLRQIDHLCRELEISKKNSNNNKENRCLCKTKQNDQTKETNSGNSSQSQNSKQELLKKIVDGKYEISEEEIHELTEYDLQNVISGILNNDAGICSVCNQNNEPEDSPKLTEIVPDSKSESAKLDDQAISVKKSSDLNINVIHSNIDNFNCSSAEKLKYMSSCDSMESKNSEREEKSTIYDRCCLPENKENQKDNEQEMLEDDKIIKKTCSKTLSDNLSETKNIEGNPDIEENLITEKISSKTISDDLNKTKSLEEKLFEGKVVISDENNKKSRTSIGAYDQLLKSMLNSLPTNLEKNESVNQICGECKNTNISSLDPVYMSNQSDETETAESLHYPSKIENKNVEICPLEPLCSTLKAKENEIILELKLLAIQLSAEEQSQCGDLCAPNGLCSGQNTNENKIIESEQTQLSIKEQKSVPLCLLDPVWSDEKSFEKLNVPLLTKEFCSKQMTKENEIVETKQNQSEEQNKTVDLCSVDPFCSKQMTNSNETVETKQKLSGVPLPMKEQNKTEDLCSLYPFCSNLMTNVNETVETKNQADVSLPIKEQNNTDDLCSLDPFCSKLTTKDNEVSIVPQKSPVDIVKNSDSIKTVSLDSKTTQTSFTEKTECVKNCNSCVFHSDSNVASTSKLNDSKIVYENDNKSNLDNVDSKLKPSLSENENRIKEKNKFISSITSFILDKTFSKMESSSSKKELQRKHLEKTCCKTNEEKSDFVSTVEKLINDRTKDLYQYSLPEKKKSVSLEIPVISTDSLDKYQTEYRKQYTKKEIQKIKRKNSVSNKHSESSISDGEISVCSSNSSLPQKLGNKIVRTSQPQILEHLKKYEQNKNRCSRSSCLHNYELKVFEEDYDNYVPKFRRSMFFPAAGTQTSNTNFNPGFNDNLLSDGEIQNTSSETEDTKTEVSEI